MLDSQRVIVVFGVAGDVFHHVEEGRKLDVLVAGNAFGFENHKVVDGLQVGVELEELPLVDETPANLVYRLPIGVGLL